MRKNAKAPRDARPSEDTYKLYARAYGSRLSKRVAQELDSTRRKSTGRKKPNGKG
jgi:hypothetical protein